MWMRRIRRSYTSTRSSRLSFPHGASPGKGKSLRDQLLVTDLRRRGQVPPKNNRSKTHMIVLCLLRTLVLLLLFLFHLLLLLLLHYLLCIEWRMGWSTVISLGCMNSGATPTRCGVGWQKKKKIRHRYPRILHHIIIQSTGANTEIVSNASNVGCFVLYKSMRSPTESPTLQATTNIHWRISVQVCWIWLDIFFLFPCQSSSENINISSWESSYWRPNNWTLFLTLREPYWSSFVIQRAKILMWPPRILYSGRQEWRSGQPTLTLI